MENKILKTCLIHGALVADQVIKSGKHDSGNQRYSCKVCHKKMRDANFAKNKTKIYARHLKRKLEDPEKYKSIKRLSEKKNRAKHRRAKRERERKWRASKRDRLLKRYMYNVLMLSDTYTRKLLIGKRPQDNLSMEEIPKEVLDLKKAYILIQRKLKEIDNEQRETQDQIDSAIEGRSSNIIR